MVQSPSWEANWFAASQEIPRISRNPKVHYRTHKRPPPVSILDQPNPVNIATSPLLEFHPNIIHPSTPRSTQRSLPLRFPLIKKLTVCTVQTDGTKYKNVHSQKLHSLRTVGCIVRRISTFVLSLIFNMHILKIEFFKDMKLCHWLSYRRLVRQYYFRNYGN